ncbi:DUF3109 family protein [Myroides odoratimimus]|uniref:DUF3109 family protein n=2 Tax=Myroides odoratimimus TaxID=76832 RepID=A0AAI8G446_9FLAO|nr:MULTISPECIES: DUF3109 family protein [Myroides]AJA68604.1 Protein of unknown function DUF3109 [Myroides sp. A21]ALU25877.1 hypothetical protein AS202_06845 [Myroides odoratimimus]EHO14551.1 hypothetical protein HMPREF9714_00381 [Myroides odoratimimus CCUG 12901]MCA4791583.1 DUF3109 family protein [Myroides odoratimimus]MCA4804859.1 DUF3109 family protein [Myroides odoratimimus]
MFQIGKTIVSEEVLEKEFVCNLSACKGECCIDGDAGAPVEDDEVEILRAVYDKVKPFLRPEGIKAIEEQGTSVYGDDDEYETPLIEGGECAYVIYENEMALCGIEKAYNEGLIDWKKPISCHLYPIRIKEFSSFSAVNYHKWHICSDACTLGQELSVPVYKFLKTPLIRKYGEDWYKELELVAEEWSKSRQ